MRPLVLVGFVMGATAVSLASPSPNSEFRLPNSDDQSAEERYVAHLRRQAAEGDAEAEVSLGGLYEAGSVLPQDPAQAAEWYRRAAARGHAGAQANLAQMYLDGHGVPRDARQALAWFERAAGGGDAMAQMAAAELHETGAAGVAPDAGRATHYYRLAAEQGLARGQHHLGLAYRDGRGVPRDAEAALAWLTRASDQGDENAQVDLGVLLLAQTPPRRIEAHAWLNLSASRWKDESTRVRAARLRDELEAVMTDDERRQAYRHAADWQDAHAWRAIPTRLQPR